MISFYKVKFTVFTRSEKLAKHTMGQIRARGHFDKKVPHVKPQLYETFGHK